MTDHDVLLRQTIARHFPAASIDARVVALGVGDLSIECWVNHVGHAGNITHTSLYFVLSGGVLGHDPIFASITGYGTSAEESIVTGACNWACSFGPVLRAGLTDEAVPDVPTLSVEIDGQELDVFVDALDRTLGFEPGIDLHALGKDARARFAPTGWLTQAVIDSGVLPLIAADRPTILSVFVADNPGKRIAEIKIDGADWPNAGAVFADVAVETLNGTTMMRELAVLVPSSRAPALTRDPIVIALAGLGDPTIPRDARNWPGWAHHGGVLRGVYTEDVLLEYEAMTGPLPAEYRAFVMNVGSCGAGPGYGLIDPLTPFQGKIIGGDFTWTHDTEPTTALGGALALAHAGCGVMWILVLRGSHRGEVWLDARGSDKTVRRVAPSFDAWYRQWISSALRNVPFVQWDPNCCASAGVFRQVVDRLVETGVAMDAMPTAMPKALKAGALKLATDSVYFEEETTLNPCYGCITIARQLGLEPTVFAAGTEPS